VCPFSGKPVKADVTPIAFEGKSIGFWLQQLREQVRPSRRRQES
jgi:hypothetical protein